MRFYVISEKCVYCRPVSDESSRGQIADCEDKDCALSCDPVLDCCDGAADGPFCGLTMPEERRAEARMAQATR